MNTTMKLLSTAAIAVAFAVTSSVSAFSQDKPGSTNGQGMGITTSCGNYYVFYGNVKVDVFQVGDKKVTNVYVDGKLVLSEGCSAEGVDPKEQPKPEPKPQPAPDPKK